MPPKPTPKKKRTILLAETDVIVRLVLAQHLRECAHTVLEAATASEAKAILQSGQRCDVLVSDAQLAGGESGFALAQWTRRYRPKMKVVLTATLMAKALAIVELCGSTPNEAPADAAALNEKVRLMLAERSRRARRPASTAPARPRKSVRP